MKRVGIAMVVLVLLALGEGLRRSASGRICCSASIPEIMVNGSFRLCLVRYKLDCGRFPGTEEGLEALVRAPVGQINWKGPYLENRDSLLPLDPWNRPYRHRFPGEKNPDGYDLWSDGPDPARAHDDITSWPKPPRGFWAWLTRPSQRGQANVVGFRKEFRRMFVSLSVKAAVFLGLE